MVDGNASVCWEYAASRALSNADGMTERSPEMLF